MRQSQQLNCQLEQFTKQQVNTLYDSHPWSKIYYFPPSNFMISFQSFQVVFDLQNYPRGPPIVKFSARSVMPALNPGSQKLLYGMQNMNARLVNYKIGMLLKDILSAVLRLIRKIFQNRELDYPKNYDIDLKTLQIYEEVTLQKGCTEWNENLGRFVVKPQYYTYKLK